MELKDLLGQELKLARLMYPESNWYIDVNLKYIVSDIVDIAGMVTGSKNFFPQYTRVNDSAFQLMAMHSCYPSENGTGSIIVFKGPRTPSTWAGDIISYHENKEAAIRYVIVLAVIEKLLEEKRNGDDRS